MLQNKMRPIGFALPGKRVGIVGSGQLNSRLWPGEARVELRRLDHIVAIKHFPMMHLVVQREKTSTQLWNIGQFEILVIDEDGMILLRKRTALLELPLERRKGIKARQRRVREQRRLHIPAHMLIGRKGN